MSSHMLDRVEYCSLPVEMTNGIANRLPDRLNLEKCMRPLSFSIRLIRTMGPSHCTLHPHPMAAVVDPPTGGRIEPFNGSGAWAVKVDLFQAFPPLPLLLHRHLFKRVVPKTARRICYSNRECIKCATRSALNRDRDFFPSASS